MISFKNDFDETIFGFAPAENALSERTLVAIAVKTTRGTWLSGGKFVEFLYKLENFQMLWVRIKLIKRFE